MYMLKESYGDVDEPETWTVEVLGTYEARDEACEAAAREFAAIMEGLRDDGELCFGEVEGGCGDYYVTYGYLDCELGRVLIGYDHYYRVYVIER